MRRFSDRRYLCQFRSGDSFIHRAPAGWKLLISAVLGIGAFGAREPLLLVVLFAIDAGYYALARLSVRDFWRDIRLFLIQTAIIVALFVARDGLTGGLGPGVQTGLQILLFFLPMAVFLRTTSAVQLMKSLQKIMPRRAAFYIFTSFRFIPFFAREIGEIATAQRLRGARLDLAGLRDPRHWQDVYHCLMIPLIVRALKTAQEAALSAEVRGFGKTD